MTETMTSEATAAHVAQTLTVSSRLRAFPLPYVVMMLCLCIAAALLILPPLPALAQESELPKRVYYGYDNASPPFTYEREGKASGFYLELLERILADTGIQILTRPLSLQRLLIELSAGDVQISSGLEKTQQRLLLYVFNEKPILTMRTRLFTKNKDRVGNIKQLRGKTAAVRKGSIYQTALEEMGGLIVKQYDTDSEAIKALYREEVDAYCGPDRTALFLIQKLGLNNISPVGTPLSVANVYYALNREDQALVGQINEGLRIVMEMGLYDQLVRKWFVKELTDEELDAMIKASGQAAAYAYAPYTKYSGGAAVLGQSGAIYTGCTVENGLQQLSSSALEVAVYNAVASGEADIRAAVTTTSNGQITPPSANERRLLYEFSPEMLVVISNDSGGYGTFMASQLLPQTEMPVRDETIPENLDFEN